MSIILPILDYGKYTTLKVTSLALKYLLVFHYIPRCFKIAVMIYKECKNCCQNFLEKENTHRPQLFCKKHCRDKFFSRERNGQNPYFSVLIDQFCKNCNFIFKKWESSRKIFCSKECYKKSFSAQIPPTHTCLLCKNEFKTRRNVPAKFCSDKCRSLAAYRRKKNVPVEMRRFKNEYGKGYISKAGYRIVYKKGHPNANARNGVILEHILVKSNELGRPLRKGETVHHINGVRSDNRPENLKLWTSRHPSGVEHEDKIKSAIAILTEEGYKISKI